MEKITERNSQGRLIAAGSADADIRYGSGFNAADEFIYFERGGERFTAVSTLEFSRALEEVKEGVQVVELAGIRKKYPAEESYLVSLSKYYGITEWLVPERFPLGYADALRKNGIAVQCVQGDFFPERAVKTPEELEKIRQMMRITENAMRCVQDMIRSASVNTHGMLVRKNGDLLTSEWVRREVEAELKRQSCTADRTIIAGGLQGAAPHCVGEGPLPAGMPVVCDIFPRSDETGYWGDMTRTFCKGTPSPIVRRAFESVRNAAEKALAMLKAGVTGEAVHVCAAKSMAADGFTAHKNADGIPCGFIHGLGHGVGLDIHEQPRLSPANKEPLPVNAVVSVEPGLYDPAWGGIRLEDLVAVTENGYENFCTMEKVLEVE